MAVGCRPGHHLPGPGSGPPCLAEMPVARCPGIPGIDMASSDKLTESPALPRRRQLSTPGTDYRFPVVNQSRHCYVAVCWV